MATAEGTRTDCFLLYLRAWLKEIDYFETEKKTHTLAEIQLIFTWLHMVMKGF